MAKTHVIDGVTYVEVVGVAEIGDVIAHSKEDGFMTLRPMDIDEVSTVDTSEASPAVIDMLTSLSRKIVSLESQLRDTQNNVEKLAVENANTRHRLAKHADRFAAVEDKVEMALDDICDLGERTQVLTHSQGFYNGKTSVMEFTVDMILMDINGICEKLKKIGGASK